MNVNQLKYPKEIGLFLGKWILIINEIVIFHRYPLIAADVGYVSYLRQMPFVLGGANRSSFSYLQKYKETKKKEREKK